VLRIDMVTVLVPATWKVPGAGPMPTTRNKDNAEGRVEPVHADVGELVSAGTMLPGALFEAEGENGAGGRVGVRVGVYDTGGKDPIVAVQEAVTRLMPPAALNRTNVAGADAVRTLQRAEGDPVHGGSVICDYWARIRAGTRTEPTSFILLRCWRVGPASSNEEELFDDVAGSFTAGGPASFTGPARALIVRKMVPPAVEVVEPGRFRFAGWRLGTVFHTKMVSPEEAGIITEKGIPPREGLLLLAVFFAWLAATLALVGVGGELLLGGMTTAGMLPQLRKHGLKAVIGLAVFLGGLLVFGVSTS
jgi:hypothetical protein